jgi:dTDP-4-dehydrorhamnose 3,5-epimerase
MTSITPLAIPEVLLITPKRHGDARGWFSETWSRRTLADAGVHADFVQDNQAFSARKGTLRGAIYDVAVDIRKSSPTYGRWVAAELTAEGGEQLFVPRGFAHAYCTITDDCELAYKVDGLYAPETEGGIIWSDPDLLIPWPLDGDPVLSEKDKVLPRLRDLGDIAF